MFIVTVVLLIVVYLTFAESRLHLKNGMLFGFMFLALFFSLRSTSYGNDLATYDFVRNVPGYIFGLDCSASVFSIRLFSLRAFSISSFFKVNPPNI